MPSEEYLEEVTIGALERLDGTIHLCAYDPAWPEQYLEQRRRIMEALRGERSP